MEKMQFRGFVFPHNPEKITITYQNKLIKHQLPSRGEIAQSLGSKVRQIICTGSFFGDSAAIPSTHMQNLLSATNDYKAGLLFLPNLKPFYAYLQEASFASVDDGKILPYTLIFTEEGDY